MAEALADVAMAVPAGLQAGAADSKPGWPVEPIREQLKRLLPGVTVEVVPAMDSTNSELMRRSRNAVPGPVLLVAQHQTAGRGRLGRQWHSDDGSALTFSLALELAPQDWSGLSLAVGVAIAQNLHPRLRLKWPNDIWLQERKLAGILIETAPAAQGRYVVVGVGINIGPPAAGTLPIAPAWLQELLPELDAPAALRLLAPALLQALKLFEAQGFEPFRAAFAARDLLQGRPVVLTDGTQGTARGVDAAGALQVETPAGMQLVASAEVSVRPVGPPVGPDPAAVET